MEKFEKLYRLPNHKIRENTNMNYFVFCGKNWDYYFTRKNKCAELELFEKVVLTGEYNPEKFIDLDYDSDGVCLQYA